MIVALIDSGLGLMPTAAWLRRLRPDLDLMLMTDPDHAPWGPRPGDWVIETVVATARRAVEAGASVVVIPCNTASVTALAETRTALGESVPVVGTVPAIKPAAANHRDVAIWATATTTASAYQANLIARFGGDAHISAIACDGLADAVDAGDRVAIDAAIGYAADRTPDSVEAIVLGCTHYPLVADRIAARMGPGVRLYDSAEAVARQTLRRIAEVAGGDAESGSDQARPGRIDVIASGRPADLPAAAEAFVDGRELRAAIDGASEWLPTDAERAVG